MTDHRGFTIEGFAPEDERAVREQVDKVVTWFDKFGGGAAAPPLRVVARKEPGVEHPELGPLCQYDQVAYYNPTTNIIVLWGSKDKDRAESVSYFSHEYAHFLDYKFLDDRAPDEEFGDAFQYFVTGKAPRENREHVLANRGRYQAMIDRALANVKKAQRMVVKVKPTRPTILSRLRTRIGTGRGWHGESPRHREAFWKGRGR